MISEKIVIGLEVVSSPDSLSEAPGLDCSPTCAECLGLEQLASWIIGIYFDAKDPKCLV